ncbi:MAG: site-specific integrase [Flavobacteriaceae bacterium]|nr:site-specific integrase [Flavobacteriaceae bacterium]
MQAVFKISYYLRSNYKNKEGKSSIMVRFSLNGKRCNLGSTGLFVKPSQWDSHHFCMKSKTVEARKFNYEIDSITTTLNGIFKKLEANNELDIERIKSIYKGGCEETKTPTFLEIFDEYNKEVATLVGVTITKPTYLRYVRARRYFADYLATQHKKDMELTALNHFILDDFVNYLKKEKSYTHNSSQKLVQPIKTVSEYCHKKGLLEVDLIKDYQIKLEKTERGFLREDELQKLMKKKFSLTRLEKVRDIFLFSCFTGLAYIDVANLTEDNLIEKDGRFWIMTRRQKTNVASNILLLDIPLQIIEKYRGSNPKHLLPILSNQRMNSYLKEIGDLCGIKKNLTFHLARHTFATTVTLEKGVPIETVSKMLGHTNIRTTQIYARITTEKIEKEMLALSDKLENYVITA